MEIPAREFSIARVISIAYYHYLKTVLYDNLDVILYNVLVNYASEQQYE